MAAETKSSGAAIVLSLLWTGLGQLYAGRIGKGILMMILTPVVWAVAWFGGFMALVGGAGAAFGASGAGGVGFGGVLTLLSGFAWWIWGMIDAKKLCESFNRGRATS